MCGSGYPTYPNFLPHTLNFFLHFGQTVHLKNGNGRQGMHFKVFFSMTINPFALRKTKSVYNFGLSEYKRVKRKNNCALKGHKGHIFAIFSYFLNCQK